MSLYKKIFAKENILLFLILILAFSLRIYKINLNFWQDEVYTAMATNGVLESFIPKLPSGAIYLRSFPYTYLAALFSTFVGSTELGIRLPAILLGTGSLVVFYLFINKITNRSFALITTLIISLSPWHILYSFFARGFIFQALLFFLTAVFYYQFFETKKQKYLNYSTLAILGNIFFSPVAVLSIFLTGYVFVYQKFIAKKISSQQSLILLFHGALAIISLFLPGVITPWATNNPYQVFQTQNFIFPNKYFWAQLFNFFPLGFILFLISTPYFFVKDKKFLIFPLFIFSSFVFLSIFNPFENLQPRYLSNFMFFYYLSIFYLIYQLVRGKILRFVLLLLVTDVLLINQVVNLNYGHRLPPTMVVSQSWTEFPDIKSQVDFVNKNYKKEDIVISLQPKGQTEIYLKPKLDYLLRTKNYLNEGHKSGELFVDDYSNIPVITSTEQLKTLIDSKKRVWIISSKSQELSLDHIDRDTYNYLLTLDRYIAYKGQDQYSKVYKIENK